jgi:peptidoglycan/LPS O-acetylase OafA/YrhL
MMLANRTLTNPVSLAGPRPIAASSVSGSPNGTFVFRHFPQLDGLRGLAILFVIGGHVLLFDFGVTAGRSLAGFGVLLFFVLSGFLITGLLDREKHQNNSIALPRFYLRRVLRLFPALLFFLGVVCLLIKLRLILDTPWYAVVACLIYVRNIWGRGYATAHIWSLSVEEQFYASWPWVMNVLDRTSALRVALAGTIAVTLFRMLGIYANWFNYWSGTFYERPWFRFDSILIGCAIALWLCGSANTGRLRGLSSKPLIPMVVWPGVVAWTLWGEAVTHVWFLTVQLFLAALIVSHLLLSKETLYRRVLSHPVAGWLGRISYSWYLWQQLFTIVDPAVRHKFQTFPLNVAASLLLAVISYYWIERPFLRFKDRVRERPREHIEPLHLGDRAAQAG